MEEVLAQALSLVEQVHKHFKELSLFLDSYAFFGFLTLKAHK